MSDDNPSVGLNNVSDIVNSDNPVAAVEAFCRLMKPTHEAYSRQWFLNISNFIGNQWLSLDRVTGRFVVPRAPSWRVRLVVNKILPIARTQIAKLRETEPRIYTAASTAEDADIQGADLATDVAQSIYNGSDFNDVRKQLTLWQVVAGNAYTVTVYDERAGKEIVDQQMDENGQPILDEQGNPVMRKFKTGDILIDFASPFEIVPDYSVSQWKEQNAIVRKKVRSLAQIHKRYGVVVGPEKLSDQYLDEQRIMNMVSNHGRFANTKNTLQNAATVKEMWHPPSEKYPEGRHIITANGKLLYQGRLPNKRNGKPTMPVTHFGGIEIPGRLLDMSPLENLLQLQWTYNRGRSQVIENINLLGKAKVLAPMGSIPDGAYTDEPGEIVEYDPNAGPPPEPITPPALPAYHLENLTRLQQEMEDVGGVHEISLGRLPRRATSGVALSILEEKDTTIITPMRDSLADGIAKTLSLALGIAAEKFVETRISKIVGKDKDHKIFRWKGTDLNSQDDVRVKIDQPFPSSRAAKLEFAINLVRSGILDPEDALSILQLDDLSKVKDLALKKDESKYAEMENFDLLKGGQVNAGQYEDHQLHIKVHKRLAKNTRIDPSVRQVVEQHIKEHEAFMGMGQGLPPLTDAELPGTLPSEGPAGQGPLI